MVLCSGYERKKIYIVKNRNKKAVQKRNMVFTMENVVFTMQKRNMAFTMEMMFSTEERSGGGKALFTFTSF